MISLQIISAKTTLKENLLERERERERERENNKSGLRQCSVALRKDEYMFTMNVGGEKIS